jgi:GNAT superfamily N-acetyltransferase
MIVRPATPADIAALADIGVAAYRLAFLNIIGENGLATFTCDYFSERFAREWAAVAVAEQDRTILGFAEVRDGTLDMLFIAPSHVHSGVGRLLLADAERRGAVRLECFRDNAGARSFYERHGWSAARSYSRQYAGAEHAFVAYEKPVTASA